MSNPIISIITPVYNRPTLVAEAIVSVLSQTNPNWEYILIDDGSTDNTWEVLESYSAKDERIKVFKRDREPKGANRCRNMGAEIAASEYLFFLDSDDLIGDTFVETRTKYIELYPEMDYIVFPEATLDNKAEGWFPEKKIFIKNEKDLIRFFKRDHPWLTSGPIWKKKTFLHLNGFNEELQIGQDWDIHVRALFYPHKYIKICLNVVDVFKFKDIKHNSISNSNNLLFTINNKQAGLNHLLQNSYIRLFLKTDNETRLAFLKYYFTLAASYSTEYNDCSIGKKMLGLFKNYELLKFNEWTIWVLYFTPIVHRNKYIKRLFEGVVYNWFKDLYLLW